MKIVFSRKGFDSTYGGVPSPIFPDGSFRSIPIPLNQGRQLGDCYKSAPLAAIVSDLTRGKKGASTLIHLDPDLCPDALERKPGWLPSFGQDAAAQTRLANWGVGQGDMFLFFGWLRKVEKYEHRWRYVEKAPDIHSFFGWLQVEHVLSVPAEVTAELKLRPWLADHPHIDPDYAKDAAAKRNTIYIATDEVIVNERRLGIPGGGTFPRWSSSLQLTAAGQTRSKWRVPKWLQPDGVRPAFGAHADVSRWKPLANEEDYVLLDSVPIGQEFVLDAAAYPEAEPWLEDLLRTHASRLAGTSVPHVTPSTPSPCVVADPCGSARMGIMNEWEPDDTSTGPTRDASSPPRKPDWETE